MNIKRWWRRFTNTNYKELRVENWELRNNLALSETFFNSQLSTLNSQLSLVFPIRFRPHSCNPFEKLPEERLRWEIQFIANLLNGQHGGFQQGFSFQYHITVNPLGRCFSTDVFDKRREITGCQMKTLGIKLHAPFLPVVHPNFVQELLHHPFVARQASVFCHAIEISAKTICISTSEMTQTLWLKRTLFRKQVAYHVAIVQQPFTVPGFSVRTGVSRMPIAKLKL